MSKLTFKLRTTFDTTITLDRGASLESINAIVDMYQSDDFKYMPPKQKAKVGLIAQAYLNHGEEAGVAELVRCTFRDGLIGLLESELEDASDKGSVIVSKQIKIEYLA